MSAHRLTYVAGALLGIVAPLCLGTQQPASASRGDVSPDCPVLNGVRIGADWGDSTSAGGRGGFRLGGRTTIDTTFQFNVDERRWTRPSLTAYIAGGVSGVTSGASTGLTPATDPRSEWHTCVGITLTMERPTVVVRGARGQLHLKMDLKPLTRIPGASLGDSSRNLNRR